LAEDDARDRQAALEAFELRAFALLEVDGVAGQVPVPHRVAPGVEVEALLTDGGAGSAVFVGRVAPTRAASG
jgi:hypothetical protein